MCIGTYENHTYVGKWQNRALPPPPPPPTHTHTHTHHNCPNSMGYMIWKRRNVELVRLVYWLIPANATYMRQWTGSTLLQVMACRLNKCWFMFNWILMNIFQLNLNNNSNHPIDDNSIQFVFGARLLPWTIGDLLSIWPLGKHFREIRIKMQNSSFRNMDFKMLPVTGGLFVQGEII